MYDTMMFIDKFHLYFKFSSKDKAGVHISIKVSFQVVGGHFAT